MKSRVKKNQDLHESLASNAESDIQNSNLSHFANRLNQIDDQFKRMEEPVVSNQEPTRARQHEVEPVEEKVAETFDTFENTYLKDFLDEVKEYNVKKGYRETENTQSNIIRELNIAPNVVKPVDEVAMKSVLGQVDPDLAHDIEDVSTDLGETRVFNANALRGDFDESLDLDQTIAMAVQEMVDEPDDADTQPMAFVDSIDFGDVDTENESIEIDEDIFDDAPLFIEEVSAEDDRLEFDFDAEKFKKELMEQTQTLQHKIIDQERNIDDMNDTMVRTNRLLNVVLSLLFLAIFVVLVLIVSQLPF
ncbi:hypothetical protein G7062_07550 [Erysipelothrix sp. HDW6C]|uniref:hypothetical protein n=1 Tax=Erysipelothrix sp. HDW6C TaxID=2714930 RepID=UPI00140DBE44|nr:hypothetical protein [Erysipelothrix sp. HDW6C]QIK70148.1 hypothetical protein G7062_07550 [Erysipelothrix sp. HDW6C]